MPWCFITRSTMVIVLWLLALSYAQAQSNQPLRQTFEVLLNGNRVEGMPLAWTREQVFLLGRDGAMYDFAPNHAKDFRQVSPDFRPLPATVMKSRLETELGSRYTVTATGMFLVAHPTGKQHWAERFEELYRSFVSYFQVRGFELATPEFPMIAVVYERQQDFMQFAVSQSVPANEQMLGCYFLASNRVALYDFDAGKAGNATQNLATIVHEALHQVAFNTGIHQRWSPPPRWVAEGLGTLFEAPGIWDARNHPRAEDRINRQRLTDYRANQKDRSPDRLAQLLSSDRPFTTSAIAAYAEAWALTYYLVETQPRDYARYLALTADRPPFTEYSQQDRLKDFTEVFGSDLRMFDARFQRFMGDVK